MNEDKQALRALLRKAYAQMNGHDMSKNDDRIIQNLMELSAYQNARCLFTFASMGREINTYDLIDSAYAQGKTVALPKSDVGGIMEFYEYHGTLIKGRFNIPEPEGDTKLVPSPKDIMIVPGLAFTKEGYRIGYGGGYYDRYLAKYPCITVGICRDLFIREKLPVSWNDLPVDFVITESTLYECKNGASCEAPLI